ncbi:unnamed protein product, partial [Porites evermanni]
KSITWHEPPPVEIVTDDILVHTNNVQLYTGSLNKRLNWKFSLAEDPVLVLLQLDGSGLATITPSTSSVTVAQALSSRVNVTWVSGHVTLIISNVTTADEGVYSCQVTTANVKVWKRNINVAVVVPATITNVSSDKALLEGSDLQLFCIAYGRPAPNITWVRIFRSSSESNVLHRGTTWDFKKISRTEAGSYRCIASNGVGNPVSRTLRVNVECEYM